MKGITRPMTPVLDASWLYLVSGMAMLGAIVLLGAHDEMELARHLRDQTLALEAHHQERLDRYAAFVEMLESPDEPLVQALAASQLNIVPVQHAPLLPGVPSGVRSASVYEALEPPPLELPVRRQVDSTLERISADPSLRIWFSAGAMLCIFVGLLPTRRRH